MLESATDLELVTTKFPKATGKDVSNVIHPYDLSMNLTNRKPSQEYRFVQGLQGKVPARVDKELGKAAIHMEKGDMFRIRWDFVPGDPGKLSGSKSNQLKTDPVVGKGLHVNAEFFGSTLTTKVAFIPSGLGPIVDDPTNRNATRFDQIVKDQSAFLEYDTKPNTLAEVYLPQKRCHSPLADLASRLAKKWVSMVADAAEPELKEGGLFGQAGAKK